MKKTSIRRASTLLDYTMLIIAIVTVLISMGAYLKRGLMGKAKAAGDTIGFGRQYDGEIIYK